MASVDILKSIEPYERTQIGDALEEKHYKAGEYVINEGDVGQTFFLISEGTAVAEKNLGGP